MKCELLNCELIELGSVTVSTKGGAIGYEDTIGTLWPMSAGLAQD